VGLDKQDIQATVLLIAPGAEVELLQVYVAESG
jgi:hypothetical protein